MSITQSVRAIPPHKRGPKLIKTIVGSILFVGGFLIPKYLPFPWQVGVVVAFFGGFLASQEYVVAFATIVPATIAAVVRGLSGKNGASPP